MELQVQLIAFRPANTHIHEPVTTKIYKSIFLLLTPMQLNTALQISVSLNIFCFRKRNILGFDSNRFPDQFLFC